MTFVSQDALALGALLLGMHAVAACSSTASDDLFGTGGSAGAPGSTVTVGAGGDGGATSTSGAATTSATSDSASASGTGGDASTSTTSGSSTASSSGATTSGATSSTGTGTPTGCSGTPTPCEQLDATKCATAKGCMLLGLGCSGMAADCTTYTLQFFCESAGCNWN